MKISRRHSIVVAIAAIVLLSGAIYLFYAGTSTTTVSPPSTPERKLTKVIFMYPFSIDVTVMPYYVAYDKGWFKEEGLDVEFQRGAGVAQVSQVVAAGQADMGSGGADVLIVGRSKGERIHIIYQVFQTNPAGIAISSKLGISKIEDLSGKKVGTPPGTTQDFQFRALLKKLGMEGKVELVPAGFDPISPLKTEKVDAALAWVTNLPDYQFAGVKVEWIPFEKYGFDFPNQAIFTAESYLAKNPEVVKAFLRATTRGLKYQLEHPGETVDILLKYAGGKWIASNEVAFGRMALSPQLFTNEDTKRYGLGYVSKERYTALQAFLVERGMLPAPIDLDAFLVTKYIS